MVQPSGTPAVSLTRISKRFGSVVACDQVDLEVGAGEIHALVGENGAGKSTLMKVLYGLHRADSGELQIRGERVARPSAAEAIRRGVGMVHQHFMLVPTLSVADNVVLGAEPVRRLGWLDRGRASAEVARLAEAHGLAVDPQAMVGELSVGVQQRVEILKLLYRGARILILDEPTAVLTPQEAESLFEVLRGLRAQGSTVILITHKLGEVLRIGDRLTVMRAGRVTGRAATADVDRADIARMMVGREVLLKVERPPGEPGDVRLAATDLAVDDDRGLPAVRGLSLEVRAGEILGLAGVEGNGQSELVQALTGLRRPRAGTVAIDGARTTGWRADRLHAAGLGHVPEDRHRHGLVLEHSVAENLLLGRQRDARFAGRLWQRRGAIHREAVRAAEQHDIRPRDPSAPAATLSGGNQQKVVIARELARELAVLVASQPTRGVDIGAIESIHGELLAARAAGVAVLLVSAELDEILTLSDRIAVIHAGRIVRVVDAAEASREQLGLWMAGGGA